MEFLTGIVTDLIFFSEDVKTTTLAIAISSSLCCSVVWLFINILNHVYQFNKKQPAVLRTLSRSETKAKTHANARRNSVPPGRSVTRAILIGRQNSFPNSSPVKPHWTSSLDVLCTVPCSKCSFSSADKICPRMFCKACCQGNIKTVCGFHSEKSKTPFRNVSGDCFVKPKQVDLSHLNLMKCPDRVGFMGYQLASLDLSNNCLYSLPIEIGCLLGLQQLYLQHNNLSQLPIIIRNLIQLQELCLDHNKLANLPETLGDLKQLCVLSVCHNQLRMVPGDLGKLKHLLDLRLSKNLIEVIPEDMCSLPKLKRLQLRKNRLTNLPERILEMVRLSEIDVSHNFLGVLPNNLTKCAFMTRISCANNRLKHLPSHIHRLQHLKHLNVCSNQLSYLPASLHGLDLHVLGADNNPLRREGPIQARYETHTQEVRVVPQLVELGALYITSRRVTWRNQNLPLVLEDILESIDHCSSCEGPLLETCQSRLEFYTLTTNQRVPLHQKICPPHAGKKCSFLQLVSSN